MNATRELRCFDYVNRPFTEVRDVLRQNPNDIFRRATSGAAGRAESLVATLHVDIAGLEIGKEVRIEVSSIKEHADASLGPVMVFQLAWHATGGGSLFPAMKADLSVYRLSKDETQLDLRGNYEPPLGALGKVLDALVMHRVAEASVHRFVVEVAALLKAERPIAQEKLEDGTLRGMITGMKTSDINAKIDHAASKAKDLVTKAGDKTSALARKAADTVDEVAKKAEKGEHRLQETAERASHALKELASKVGHGAQEAAEKVDHGANELTSKAEHRAEELTPTPKVKP